MAVHPPFIMRERATHVSRERSLDRLFLCEDDSQADGLRFLHGGRAHAARKHHVAIGYIG